jgi:hypothetical protein
MPVTGAPKPAPKITIGTRETAVQIPEYLTGKN